MSEREKIITKDVIQFIRRRNAIVTHKKISKIEDDFLLTLLKSNYIYALLNVITVYTATSGKTKEFYLKKCSDFLYILGYSPEYIDTFIKRMKKGEAPLIVLEFVNHTDRI